MAHYGTQTDSNRRGSVAADVIGSAVEVDEPLMAAGMDRGTAGAWRGFIGFGPRYRLGKYGNLQKYGETD